jgi:microcystin-dependent protein
MSDPYIGEIRMFGGTFAPVGWAFCEGQVLAISQFDALFNLIGTTYGGDGQETFQLPDLRGRVPLHTGPGFVLGQAAGVEDVTLNVQQLPLHSHPFLASVNQAGTTNPPSNVAGQMPGGNVYIQDQASVALAPPSLLPAGGSQPHTNVQPFQCISFIIALDGIYPPPS